jgi:hypothetical protein
MGIEIVYAIGAVALLAALIWGTMRYRQRSRSEKARGDQKARELFRS